MLYGMAEKNLLLKQAYDQASKARHGLSLVKTNTFQAVLKEFETAKHTGKTSRYAVNTMWLMGTETGADGCRKSTRVTNK
jgi:hypothetical protein